LRLLFFANHPCYFDLWLHENGIQRLPLSVPLSKPSKAQLLNFSEEASMRIIAFLLLVGANLSVALADRSLAVTCAPTFIEFSGWSFPEMEVDCWRFITR
jgi:hypothetical protein